STFGTQNTSGKSDLVFNNQGIIDEFDSIFDNQEIFNQILTYESAEIFERTILENENNMFIDKIDESQNNDSEYSDISEIDYGLLFLDTLRKNRTKFFSTSAAQIKNQIYSFEYRPILSAVEEILQQQEIVTNCLFDYQKVYSSVEASTESSQHSIYISLGNISTNLYNRVEAKALVGIIPILQGTKEE
ncbi:16783_t:CDS:2, partial [Cetraspora pellucida]